MRLTVNVHIFIHLFVVCVLGTDQWWSAFLLLFLSAPYLVSYCALASIIQSHEQQISKPWKLFLITPLSLVFLVLVDVIFMLYVTMSVLLLSITSCCVPCRRKLLGFLQYDLIFRHLKITEMEIKGYRRLRTLSQLMYVLYMHIYVIVFHFIYISFETLPQVLLQWRILTKMRDDTQVEFSSQITVQSLMISIMIGLLHAAIEFTMLYYESRACKENIFRYAITCLNARLNWVPLLHFLNYNKNRRRLRISWWQQMKNFCKCCCFCCYHSSQNADDNQKRTKIFFKNREMNFEYLPIPIPDCFGLKKKSLNFKFGSSGMRRLADYITRLQPFTDSKGTEVKQLAMLFPAERCNIHRIILGRRSCKKVSLRDLAHLYRNAQNRVIIDGGADIDWKMKVSEATQGQEPVIEHENHCCLGWSETSAVVKHDYNVGSYLMDFMQHAEIDAIYELFSAVKQSTKNIFQLKMNFLIENISDVYTLRRFFRHHYTFGSNCNETHIIYDRVLNYFEKVLSLIDENEQQLELENQFSLQSAVTFYGSTVGDYRGSVVGVYDDHYTHSSNKGQEIAMLNMIILILWYTQSSILGHRCPQCNVTWQKYIAQRMSSVFILCICLYACFF